MTRRYEILSERVIHIRKFRAIKRKIVFKIKEASPFADVLEWIRSAILEITTYLSSIVQEEDKVGLTFYSDNFKHKLPGWMSYRRASDFTFENVWDVMGSVFQSNTEGLSTETFRMEVTTVSPPTGSGRQRVYNNYVEECSKRRGIVVIRNNDNLCLVRAVVVGKAHVDKNPKYERIRRTECAQKEQAVQLLQEAGVVIPPAGGGIEELRQLQRHLKRYKIVVYQYGTKGRQLVFEGPEASKKINLLYNEGHFNVITSLTSAFACDYYCEECHIPFNNKGQHRCGATCPCCTSQPPCEKVRQEVLCQECCRSFRGESCFKRHREEKRGSSTCSTVHKCRDCLKTYNTKRRKTQHVCGEMFCKQCEDHVPENHFCYISRAKPPKEKDALFIFYDLETRQEKEDPHDPSVKIHEAYLCVFQQVCSLCYDSKALLCIRCGVREQILRGPKCLEGFTDYILQARKLFKKVIVIAHNGQAFDHQFVLNHVLNAANSIKPDLIMRGSKILLMALGNVKFIDSLNFFPMALSALPKALGLGEELKKGYFPHLFNTEDNDAYVGLLPESKYYDPDSMKPDARAEFLTWHKEHQQDEFDMQRDLVEYCRSDVDILKRACIRFRDMFIKECDVDPFTESITIASACNLMFRRKFLKPDTIGVIPRNGYRRVDNQSKSAIQWLVWEEDQRRITIQHAGRGIEARLNGLKVDGYCEVTKQVFEFHGCYYHGCPTCFLTKRNRPLHDDSGDTMDIRYESTLSKTMRLRNQGYEVVEMWECKFKQELQDNDSMHYLHDHPFLKNTPLKPRDAFYGGRTGCTKLKYTAKEGEKIKYVDVCSLYPYICKYGRFPIGHPKVYVGKECENFISENGIPNGVIKCSILPPQNLYHPVLPVKRHDKLMFALCSRCVDDFTDECTHTPEERMLLGTWCSDEIVKAIDKGYKLIEVQEMWVYDVTLYNKLDNMGGLFSDFINQFLKLKQQASGWPSSCLNEEERESYIKEFFQSEGIRLNFDDIVKNPGLRSLAKLILNSFWGKFGQRENQSRTSIVKDPKEFYDLMWSPSIEVNYMQEVNDETVILNWQYREEAVEPLFTVNCVIAAYVTTLARLQLFSYLDLLGERVLYYDTDSVIYVSREDMPDLPLGNNLGDLTDEIEGEYGTGAFISEFASGGPKTYGYKVQLPSGETVTKIKVKGLTLNHLNSEKVNFESLVNLIDDIDREILTLTSVIRRTEDHQLITKKEEKTFRVNVQKRKRIENYDTLPYGYKRHRNE